MSASRRLLISRSSVAALVAPAGLDGVHQVVEAEPEALAVAEEPQREQDGEAAPHEELEADRRAQPGVEREVAGDGGQRGGPVVQVDGAHEVAGLALEDEPA